MSGVFSKRKRQLSPQELACLNLLAAGKTNKEMAKALSLSPATVVSYLQSLYRKLGVQTRTHAVALAIAEGLIVLDNEQNSSSGRPPITDGWIS